MKKHWGKWFSPSTLLSWDPGLLLPALGSQHKKGCEPVRGSPEEGHKDDHKASLTKAPRILQESFAPSWPGVTFCHSFAADHSQKYHIGLMDLWSDPTDYFLMLHFQMCRCACLPVYALGNSSLFAWCHGRHPLPHHHHHHPPQEIHIIPETAKLRHSSKLLLSLLPSPLRDLH